MTNPEHRTAVYESANSGVFEIPPLPQWFREPGIEDTYRPWQHTPLDPYSDQVRTHQAELRDVFRQLATAPPHEFRGKALEELVDLNILAGMAMRETLCKANFNDWVENHPDELELLRQDPEMEWLLGEGLAGHGSARGQLELLRRAPSLQSLDLQVLTTPFGYRYQHLDAMRQELHEALTDIGATIHDEPQWLAGHPPKISVDPSTSVAGNGEPGGLLVTYKRQLADIAEISDSASKISVMEREVWLVLTDESSGFSRDILADMIRMPDWAVTRQKFASLVQRYVMTRIAERRSVVPLSVATYARRTSTSID